MKSNAVSASTFGRKTPSLIRRRGSGGPRLVGMFPLLVLACLGFLPIAKGSCLVPDMLDPSSPSGSSCPTANPLTDCDGWEVSLLGSGYDAFNDQTFLAYTVAQGNGVVLDSVTISSGNCCVDDASYFGLSTSIEYGLDSDSCVNGVNYKKTLTQNTGFYKIVYAGNVPVVNNAATFAVKNGTGFCLYNVPGVDCSTPPPPPPTTPPPPPVTAHTVVLRQPLDIEIRERAVRDGNRKNIVVRRNSNKGEVRALIKFPEISNIPSKAIITSAQLRFFTKNPTEATKDIISGYTMNAAWDNDSSWAEVSGGVDLSATPQISFAFMPSTDEEDIFVDVDPLEIQAWLDGSMQNEGWVMVSDSDDNWRFRSVNGEASARPYLTVNYNLSPAFFGDDA